MSAVSPRASNLLAKEIPFGEEVYALQSLMEDFAREFEYDIDAQKWYDTLPRQVPGYKIFGLFDDEVLVGFMDAIPLDVFYAPWRIGGVTHVFVDAEYRGHGHLLMRAALDYGRSIGVHLIQVVAGEKMRRMFERMGFVVKRYEMEMTL